MNNIFFAPTDTSQQMADSLPQGRAWANKNIADSNMRRLVNSLSVAHNRTQHQVQLLDEQFRIEQADDLLAEWEKSVGLPNECTAGKTQTISERRTAVIETLRRKPIVTLAEMQAYLDRKVPHVPITLYAGEDYTSYPALPPFTPLTINKKFLIVGEIQIPGNKFEYTFEVPFSSGLSETEVLCTMNKIIPANVILFLFYQ
ncbi:MAG: hypothetical protein DRI24_19440 [Deltaproteobacteria bacterium]|nr:MAG: hypothetical protein DRI24_19440 [Deltaproteobacteria bacterium]